MSNQFSDTLNEHFDDPNFYANPNDTYVDIIFITEGKVENSVRIGNATVFNVTESNDKIPVYGYNSDKYGKYLNGKKIVSGLIALRKVTVDTFLGLSVTNQVSKINNELQKEISDKLDRINVLIRDFNELGTESAFDASYINFLTNELDGLYDMLERLQRGQLTPEELTMFFNLYPNFYKPQYEIKASPNDTSLLYYKEKSDYKDEMKILVTIEGNHIDLSTKIDDILFIKKETETNIGQSDVFEVYSFIGNININ